MTPALDLARAHGLIPHLMTDTIRRLVSADPSVLDDDAALAARLIADGFTKGEIEARLFLSANPVGA